MGAYKNLTSNDFIIAPLELNKGFRFEGSNQLISASVEIDRFLGGKSATEQYTGYLNSILQSSVYYSIKQLYYSNYISGSTGEIIYNYLINNPQSYITTVGMYNDSNELLAVAKLSKPLRKDFTKESLVRVKLDF